MKKFLCITLALLMTFCFTACGPSEEDGGGDENPDTEPAIEIRCATSYGADQEIVSAVKEIADRVAEETEGAINITVFPEGELGDTAGTYEKVMNGELEMMVDAVPSVFDSKLEMLSLPYITTSYDDAGIKFSEGSVFFDSLSEVMEESGVRLLGIFMDGFKGIGATKHIDEPLTAGLTHKELLRVPEKDTYIWTAQGMGYNTAAIAYADLYSALQAGEVDGWFGGSAYINYEGFRDILAYYADTKSICDAVPVMVNKEMFDSLPEDCRTAIRNAISEKAEEVAAAREALDDQALKDMADEGIEVYECSDEEIESMAAYFRENIWPKYADLLGEDLLATLTNS